MKEATRASGGVVSGRRTTRGDLGEKQEGLGKCTICELDFYTLNSVLFSKRDELTIYIQTGLVDPSINISFFLALLISSRIDRLI